MPIDWAKYGLPSDEEERERVWAEQFHQGRKALVEHVEQALQLTPAKRKALYQKWRGKIGDDRARTYAKFAEACIAGRVSVEKIRNMVSAYEGKQLLEVD